MKILCDKCLSEMEEKGALVFSPPKQIIGDFDCLDKDVTVKYHICKECWEELKAWIEK